MQEIIYRIDNWTLIKILGGLTIILTAIIGFFSNVLQSKIQQSLKFKSDAKLEDLKGDIDKYNSVLTSFFQNHLSSSQKVFDTKLKAYETLWEIVQKIKDAFPAGITMVYYLLTDDELNKNTVFNELDTNPKMGPGLRNYNLTDEMKKIIDSRKPLTKYRPYLSDKSFKLYYAFSAFYGRITHSFIWQYEKKNIYNWKNDKTLLDILSVTLTKEELEYIINSKFRAFESLTELLEYKIITDIREQLQISGSANDTIQYIKDIDKLIRKDEN